MFVNVLIDATENLGDVAHKCGTAPCQILMANGLKSEEELVKNSIIKVPVNLAYLIQNETRCC